MNILYTIHFEGACSESFLFCTLRYLLPSSLLTFPLHYECKHALNCHIEIQLCTCRPTTPKSQLRVTELTHSECLWTPHFIHTTKSRLYGSLFQPRKKKCLSSSAWNKLTVNWNFYYLNQIYEIVIIKCLTFD